jgi:hypothetical protein
MIPIFIDREFFALVQGTIRCCMVYPALTAWFDKMEQRLAVKRGVAVLPARPEGSTPGVPTFLYQVFLARGCAVS